VNYTTVVWTHKSALVLFLSHWIFSNGNRSDSKSKYTVRISSSSHYNFVHCMSVVRSDLCNTSYVCCWH